MEMLDKYLQLVEDPDKMLQISKELKLTKFTADVSISKLLLFNLTL